MTVKPVSQQSWIKYFFPIQSHEYSKVIPLALLKALVSFVYTLLTCLKETHIVAIEGGKAEILPVLKAWLVMPASIIVVLLYAKLSNHYHQSTLFYSIITAFIAFFAVYAFVLLPQIDFWKADPSWLEGFLGMRFTRAYSFWPHSLFFLSTELWGQVSLFILFWGLANSICSLDQAKRSYNLFITSGCVGGFCSTALNTYYTSGAEDHTQTLISYAIAGAILILGLRMWMQYYATTISGRGSCQLPRTVRPQLSVMQSIRYICSSPYLIAAAASVVACAFTIGLVDNSFYAILKQYADQEQHAKNMYQYIKGILTALLLLGSAVISLCFSGRILHMFGWGYLAYLTPLIVLFTGALFLGCIAHATTPSTPFVMRIGSMYFVASKMAKYAFFDNIKELLFTIPLNPEAKSKGKAAVDLLGSRLGKSSVFFTHSLVFLCSGCDDVLAVNSYLLACLGIATAVWLYATHYLDKRMKRIPAESM